MAMDTIIAVGILAIVTTGLIIDPPTTIRLAATGLVFILQLLCSRLGFADVSQPAV
jgi:hypothetical protein